MFFRWKSKERMMMLFCSTLTPMHRFGDSSKVVETYTHKPAGEVRRSTATTQMYHIDKDIATPKEQGLAKVFF